MQVPCPASLILFFPTTHLMRSRNGSFNVVSPRVSSLPELGLSATRIARHLRGGLRCFVLSGLSQNGKMRNSGGDNSFATRPHGFECDLRLSRGYPLRWNHDSQNYSSSRRRD